MPPVTLKLFFCLIVILKCQFLNDGCQLWPQISKLFLNQFSKFLWLSCSKFPGLLKKGQKFLCICYRTRENDKKQSGANIVGHPVELCIKMNARLKIQLLVLRKVFLKIIVIAIMDNRKANFLSFLCSWVVLILQWSKWTLMITCSLGLYSMVSSSYAHECKNNGVATTKMYCMEKGKNVMQKI